MKQPIKTLKQWEKSGKDLDEFLSPGDWISALTIGELEAINYLTKSLEYNS